MSQAQGGGCRLSQPPLLSRHRPGDTFHHLLSNKRSSQAERFLPGNLDCVVTETTTSRERERLGLAERATGTKPMAW